MRASSVFIVLLIMDVAMFMGAGVFHELNNDVAVEEIAYSDGGSRPATYFFDANTTTGELENSYNTTLIKGMVEWASETGMSLLDTIGLSNLATLASDFIGLLTGFITAPYNIAELAGLNNGVAGRYHLGLLFGSVYILTMLFSLWQIITGRNV